MMRKIRYSPRDHQMRRRDPVQMNSQFFGTDPVAKAQPCDLRDNVRVLDRAEAEGLDEQGMKTLAICYLYHVNRWDQEQIGAAFGHPKGHISRLLAQGEQHIRNLFPDLANDPTLDSQPSTLDAP